MQNSSEDNSGDDIMSEFADAYKHETDELSQSSKDSKIDSQLEWLLRNFPLQIQQKYKSLGPVNQITSQYKVKQQTDESLYFGLLSENQKNGTGIQIWEKQGNILDGTWKNDKIEGFCRMIYPNGDIFECEFHQGIANGFGIFHSLKKVVKGIWINNILEGEGQELRQDGLRYYGQFKNGKKDGMGVIYFKDGCKYEGEMKNNHMNGQGCFVWNDNSYLNCKFKKGKVNGNGIYVSGNGNIFQGYFQEIDKGEGEYQNKCIQRIIFINEANVKLTIEKIRQE